MVNVMDKEDSEGRSNLTKEKLCVDIGPIGSRHKSLGSPDTTISDDDFNRSLPSSPIADEKDEEGCLKRHLDVLGAPRGRPVAWAVTNPSGVMLIEPERSCTRPGINGRGLPSSLTESPKNSHGLLSTVVGFVGHSTWTKTRDDKESRILTHVTYLLISLPTLIVKEEKPNDSFPFKTNQELSRHPLEQTMTPCSSDNQSADEKTEWKALDEAIGKLTAETFEGDDGQERRPANVDAARKLLPLLKAHLKGFPVPIARTEYDGCVDLVWINDKLGSVITCSIQMEEENEELDVSKYIPGQDPVYRLLSFSFGDHEKERAVIETIQGYLADGFP